MTDLAALRKDLVARLAELGQKVEEFEDALREPLEADFAEQATQMESAEVTADLEHAALVEAEQIKAAVDRIDNGTYGECAHCGKAINPKRLEALPYAIDCIECASLRS
jgi:RNA polymerase-binding transcription factor DksA